MKTYSTENYLKAIYHLREETGSERISTNQLSAYLGVAAPSTTEMLKKMAALEPRLVEYQPYGGVRLTAVGEKAALEVIRHHRLIETYLNRFLGFSWDEVHEEAEQLEHAISEELEERIAQALNYPRTDPHGEPIPTREGVVEVIATIPLSQVESGASATIQQVFSGDPELLRYLERLGLVPQVEVDVLEKASLDRPLHLRLRGPSSPILAIEPEVANRILVIL